MPAVYVSQNGVGPEGRYVDDDGTYREGPWRGIFEVGRNVLGHNVSVNVHRRFVELRWQGHWETIGHDGRRFFSGTPHIKQISF